MSVPLKTVEINCCGISRIVKHKDKNGLEACMFCDEEQLNYPFVTVRAEIHDLHWEKMKANMTRQYLSSYKKTQERDWVAEEEQ